MRQMPAVREIHTHERIALLEQSVEHRVVGVCAAVRLNIRVLRAEKLFRARNGERFDLIDELATAVIAFFGITFGVLIRKHRAGSLEHGFGNKVLARYKFDLGTLSVEFVRYPRGYLGIDFRDCFDVHVYLLLLNIPVGFLFRRGFVCLMYFVAYIRGFGLAQYLRHDARLPSVRTVYQIRAD